MRFLQSAGDFPLLVSLGKQQPSWGLARGGGGLRFVPTDDEGFSLRGDRRQLLYKGRRRSHRFTILGDAAFEYDVILEREPESNAVSLRMEGAEKYDFFRQPDFLADPLLAGSYAVYAKETLVGAGTGKLCHICRPEIIDSRGRRCWGDLSIAGNELRVTIPETFLSNAAYPVTVDPTIGTSTVGSQYQWTADAGEKPEDLMFDMSIPVNGFLAPEKFVGACAAYAYTNSDDPEAGGLPVLYSDGGGRPRNLQAIPRDLFDFRVSGGKPKGWRAAAFETAWAVEGGSSVWFGVMAAMCWLPRFDYGLVCLNGFWDLESSLPPVYPAAKAAAYNMKLSMYFSYTAARAHTRTLTQGVSVADKRELAGGYKRPLAQTGAAHDALGRAAAFPRQCLATVASVMQAPRFPVFCRAAVQGVAAAAGIANCRGLSRAAVEKVGVGEIASRVQGLLRAAGETIGAAGAFRHPVLYARFASDAASGLDALKQFVAYARRLAVEAASAAETSCGGEYCRGLEDEVGAQGMALRSLAVVLKILTGCFARDFVLRRFLVGNEEMVLKSAVCREIILESKIS